MSSLFSGLQSHQSTGPTHLLEDNFSEIDCIFFKIYSSINHTFSENTNYHTVTGAVPFQKVLYNIYSLGTNMYF